jgi:hypothetical protein
VALDIRGCQIEFAMYKSSSNIVAVSLCWKAKGAAYLVPPPDAGHLPTPRLKMTQGFNGKMGYRRVSLSNWWQNTLEAPTRSSARRDSGCIVAVSSTQAIDPQTGGTRAAGNPQNQETFPLKYEVHDNYNGISVEPSLIFATSFLILEVWPSLFTSVVSSLRLGSTWCWLLGSRTGFAFPLIFALVRQT